MIIIAVVVIVALLIGGSSAGTVVVVERSSGLGWVVFLVGTAAFLYFLGTHSGLA